MTADIAAHGLGALPDPPDERDYALSALSASEGLTVSVILPATYVAPGMPPILDQGSSPMCVAYSTSVMKAGQDRWDQERFFDSTSPFDFDEPSLSLRPEAPPPRGAGRQGGSQPCPTPACRPRRRSRGPGCCGTR